MSKLAKDCDSDVALVMRDAEGNETQLPVLNRDGTRTVVIPSEFEIPATDLTAYDVDCATVTCRHAPLPSGGAWATLVDEDGRCTYYPDVVALLEDKKTEVCSWLAANCASEIIDLVVGDSRVCALIESKSGGTSSGLFCVTPTAPDGSPAVFPGSYDGTSYASLAALATELGALVDDGQLCWTAGDPNAKSVVMVAPVGTCEAGESLIQVYSLTTANAIGCTPTNPASLAALFSGPAGTLAVLRVEVTVTGGPVSSIPFNCSPGISVTAFTSALVPISAVNGTFLSTGQRICGAPITVSSVPGSAGEIDRFSGDFQPGTYYLYFYGMQPGESVVSVC